MPNPIDKFTIVRALQNIAHVFHESAAGRLPGPEMWPDLARGVHELRDRLIATTPEQLDAPRGQPTLGMIPAADGETIDVTIDGVVRMRLGHGLCIDNAGVLPLVEPIDPRVRVFDDEPLDLAREQSRLRSLLEALPYQAPETHPHAAIVALFSHCCMRANGNGLKIDGGAADGAGHADEPAPADAREPAQREGDDPPAPGVPPARALQLLANLSRFDGDAFTVTFGSALSTIGERSWMQARHYLREVETIALALASDAGELAVLAERLAPLDEPEEIPF